MDQTAFTTDAFTADAWLNGRIVPFSAAGVPVWDLGVVAGASVTEMARTYRHQPFRLNEHLRRLFRSCDELSFAVPFSEAQVREGAESTIKRNCRSISGESDLGVVAFVTAGVNRTYLGSDIDAAPTVCVHTFPLPFSLWKDAAVHGLRLRIPSRRQIPDEVLPVHLKTRNRLHWWLADREAAQLEAGSKALLLNSKGCVTETSTSCFYAVLDGTIVTAESDVLDSMTRRIVEELAAVEGIPFRRSDFTLWDLRSAEEAFTTSTPTGLLPVSTINGEFVGEGSPGRIFRRLQSAWTRLTGVDTLARITEAETFPADGT